MEVRGNAHDMHLGPPIKFLKMCTCYYISYYLEHTTPHFEQLDILSFKKLSRNEYLY